jgi:hypothetical protein
VKPNRAAASKVARLRTVPWVFLLQAGAVLRSHWRSLSRKDRTRVTTLLRTSRGRPGNLSAKEREELRALVGKLDLKAIARDLAPLGRPRKKRR